VSENDARRLLGNAKEFVEEAGKYLKDKSVLDD